MTNKVIMESSPAKIIRCQVIIDAYKEDLKRAIAWGNESKEYNFLLWKWTAYKKDNNWHESWFDRADAQHEIVKWTTIKKALINGSKVELILSDYKLMTD